MHESLPPDLHDFVAAKLATGQFRTVDDVAIVALRRLRDAEAQDTERLRTALQHAQAQIERGECFGLEDDAGVAQYIKRLTSRVNSESCPQ